jgi:hypothetical protein
MQDNTLWILQINIILYCRDSSKKEDDFFFLTNSLCQADDVYYYHRKPEDDAQAIYRQYTFLFLEQHNAEYHDKKPDQNRKYVVRIVGDRRE